MSTKDWKNQINKECGEGIAGVPIDLPRFSSNILELDIATKQFVRGRSILVVGPESSGKTYITHSAQAAVNLVNWETGEIDPTYSNPSRTCLIDCEGTFDPNWAEQVGVLNDPDINVHVLPDNAEQACDIAYSAFTSGQFSLVVFDSLDAALMKEEESKSFEEHVVGKKPIAINRLFRKITSAGLVAFRDARTDKKKLEEDPEHQITHPMHRVPTFMAINQPREKIGVMFGDPTTYPGGRGQSFYSSVILNMHKPNVQDKGVVQLKGVVKKNKTHLPKIAYTFDVALKDQNKTWLAGKTDQVKPIFNLVKKYLMGGKGGAYTVLDRTYKKQDDIKDDLQTDIEFREKAKLSALEAMNEQKSLSNTDEG